MPAIATWSKTLKRRYWDRVEKRGPDECWPWTGGDHGNRGHGKIYVGRRGDGSSVSDYAHRVGWMLHSGEYPGDLQVRHRCDNPPCQNPRHWELGTNSDNVRDRVERGRTISPPRPGELNPAAKLTESDVLQIISLRRGGIKIVAIAAQFGIRHQHVSRLANGTRWQHLQETA